MEQISNEEKARQLCCSGCNNYVCYTNKRQCPTLKDLLRMAQWKDEQKPDWSEYDKVVIDAIYNTLKHGNVTKCGVEVTVMLLWLEELEKQGKRNSADPFLNWLEKQGEQNNIVQQLTAFAQHLQKRGAFRDDLCMDFEHEAQSFIEMQNNKKL